MLIAGLLEDKAIVKVDPPLFASGSTTRRFSIDHPQILKGNRNFAQRDRIMPAFLQDAGKPLSIQGNQTAPIQHRVCLGAQLQFR